MRSEINISVVVALLMCMLLLGFIFTMVLLYRHRKRKYEAAEAKAFLEQEIIRSQLEIQEQTFQKISQEIHDNIGQMLSLAKLFLSTVESKEGDKITEAHHLVGRSIQALRDLSHTLNSDYVSELGFLRAVEFELELIRKTGRLKTELNVTGEVVQLSPQSGLIIFRILQETINNIIKHAEAQQITVDVNYANKGLMVKIMDDGKGFDMSVAPKNGCAGIGMKNIQTRAKLIGAEVRVSSEVGKGTVVVINYDNG